MPDFKLHADYRPTGDQPQAIQKLVEGFREGNQFQTLLGSTGSGKTFTMANVIEQLQMPTLVIAHNKTLAAQLYSEFKEFFPENAVEYFVSYYDYYQPEAYVPSSDTYIAKERELLTPIVNRQDSYNSSSISDMKAYSAGFEDYSNCQKYFNTLRDSLTASFDENDPLREQFWQIWVRRETELHNELLPIMTGKLH